MTQKFGRNYKLTIDPKDNEGLIVIQLPFTCRFSVKRDLQSSVNNSSIDIFNLSYANRKRIFQDRNNLGPNIVNGESLGRKSAQLDIGYGNELHTVWKGDILMASSAREGVDIVTRLESLVGIFDLASSLVNITLPAGTTLTQVFKTLIGQMPTLQYGFVSDFPQTFIRPIVLSGKPWDLINQYSSENSVNGASINSFIDNNKIYVMSGNDKLSTGGIIPVLNAASGVLETPRREQTYLSVTTLLESEIQINSIVQIQSGVEPAYNGQYGVIGLQHTGIISGAVSGDARSTFFLLKPNFATYNVVKGA